MLQIFVIFGIFLSTLAAWSITEQEYLAKNKTYTDGLLAYFQAEDKANLNLNNALTAKKTAEASLKKATTELAATAQKLSKEEARLVSLKDKLANKNQLESNLQAQKQQNLFSINNLNGQISNTSNSLQNVNFQISQLENEKNLIVQKFNTQKQLVALAENNIRDLEFDIRRLEREIDQNNNRIQRLRQEIQSLEVQKNASNDPAVKQQLQLNIEQNRNRIQQLKSENDFAENRLSSKKFQLINENSQLNQEQNKLSSLQIQYNGKQNEINSQVSLQNRLENDLASLRSQKENLVSKNNSIDAELDVLANLPTYIANSEQTIQNLKTLKTQQDQMVAVAQAEATTTGANVTQQQQKIEAEKVAMLASEKAHDAALKEFALVATPVAAPAVIAEGTISIDSLLVTEEIAKSKDWSVFRGTSTTLSGTNVCAASTQVLDTVSGVLSELMVVRTSDQAGVLSSPFLVTTHSRIADLVIQGQLKTDKAKSILLPILQSSVANEKALIARYSDTASLVGYLKAHNSAKVEFTVPGVPIAIPFSLRGSSAMINEMLVKCKN